MTGRGIDPCGSLHAGALFGGVRLLRELGRGGMGVVWLAEDETLSRHVAVKVLRMPPDLSHDGRERGRERFLREARTMASFRHPSILPVYSVGKDPATGLLFFTMEPCLLSDKDVERLCEESLGCPLPVDVSRWTDAPSALTLADVLAHNAFLAPRAVARIGCEIADALGYAHGREKAVIHRDVKPSNILFDREGHLRLVDFGIARRVRTDELPLTTVSITPVFSNGEKPFVGTVEFAAPEQRERNEPCAASDFYSLGLVLYRSLVGRMPGTLTPPSRLDPGRIAPGWDALFEGLLEVDPARRLADPVAIRKRLTRLADTSHRGRRRRIVAWAFALCALVAVAVALWPRGKEPGAEGTDGTPTALLIPPPPGMAWTSDADGGNFRLFPRGKAAEEVETMLRPNREKEDEEIDRLLREWQERVAEENAIAARPAVEKQPEQFVNWKEYEAREKAEAERLRSLYEAREAGADDEPGPPDEERDGVPFGLPALSGP